MNGCIAPSEIPGISSSDASVFGAFAEELIYADFCSKYSRDATTVFRDHHNPAAYLYFLAKNNPHFNLARQTDYYSNAWANKFAKIPDFLLHKPIEKAFYEVKPESQSGITAGLNKIDKLNVVYSVYKLPYRPGTIFRPRDHAIAYYGSSVRIKLRVGRLVPGLIVYKLCVESSLEFELATLVILLAYIVRLLNRERRRTRFRPIDLEPVFSSKHLGELAKALGLGVVTAAVTAVGWRHFWKAVVKRFALRGSLAATLSAADGPLPVGELISVGLAIWTVIDIVRYKDDLWQEAKRIARQQS